MKIRRFLGCLLAIAGLVGCVAHTEDTRGTATTAAGTEAPAATVEVPGGVTESAEDHLALLSGLELFEVGDLLVRAPAMATNCYGPCPQWQAMTDAEREAEIDAVRDAQEERLAALTEISMEVRAERSDLTAVDVADVEEHLNALRRLAIVGIGDLVSSEAEASPYCYNLPCADDVERAERDNALRAAEIAAIAVRAEDI